ncbi:MAG TPA: hypothetical protein VL287_12560 [Gemmatimonadales bacterium]|nr:hypothetical protein [Gemmatimonadales bacterium]
MKAPRRSGFQSMAGRSIVVGVDASSESRRAGAVAWEIAQASGMNCHLVHAVPDARVAKAIGSVPVHDRLLIGSATEWLLSRLAASLLVVPFARAKRR